mmetsp:Transcript_7007/g.18172  ORF Transcript_7007/g.18172 Transcript_7007/m.18172 type:complete len:213 (-) Transcript_7007:727-1365(-)
MGKVCKENISPISVAIFEVPGCMVVFVVHGILRPLGRELFPEIFRGPGLDRRFGRVDALHARISSSVLRLPLRIVEQLVGEFYPTAGPGCLVIQNGAASFLCRATENQFQDHPVMYRLLGSSAKCHARALRSMSVAAISALVSFSTSSGVALVCDPNVLFRVSWRSIKPAVSKRAKRSRWSSLSFFVFAILSSAATGNIFFFLRTLFVLLVV